MKHIEIFSTDDVSTLAINDFINELEQDEIQAESGGRLTLLSTLPPSWVTLIIEADWLIKVFGAYAAIYVAEIVKEAGKDTWKNRAEAITAASKGANKIGHFIQKYSGFKKRLSERTDCVVAVRLGIDYEYDKAGILLSLDNPNLATLQFAIFTHHIPKLLILIEERSLRNEAATGIRLNLLDDGSLCVMWLRKNGNSFDQCSETLPFNPSTTS